MEYPPLASTTGPSSTSNTCTATNTTQPTMTATTGYATEMLLLAKETSELKTIITTAMEQIKQIKQALASLHATPHVTFRFCKFTN